MKERICCVCRKKDLATNRIRVGRQVLLDGSHKFFIDESGKGNGRGAYVCQACVPDAIKKRAFNRSFKGNVPQEIYDELKYYEITLV